MTSELARYDDAVHSIYEAALQPHRWQEVMAGIAHLFAACSGLIFTWAHAPDKGGIYFTYNISEASLAQWGAKSMQEDPFVQAGLAKGLMQEGVAVLDSDLMPFEEFERTPTYRELWVPMDIGRLCTGVIFDTTDAHKLPTVISLFRKRADPAFTREDAGMLRRLVGHLSRALGVMFHLRDGQLQLASSLAALDRLGSGVVLLGASRQVQFANRAAQALFNTGGMVGLSRPSEPGGAGQMRLHPRLLSWEKRFQQMLQQALEPLVRDAQEHFSEAMVLPGEEGQPACVVHAAPLADAHGFTTGGPLAKAIVFLYDVQSAASVPLEQLHALFGMTPAEARAALQITQGGSVEDMARRLGVTANTFKTQLKAAYAKSGTNRQVDLLKVLLALAAR